MKVSLMSSTILILATCLDSVSTTNGPVVSCCRQWSNTRVRAERIHDYYIQQEGLCPVYAIVFKTLSGKRICSDPNSDFVKQLKAKVDGRTQPNTGVLATTLPPTTINSGGLGTTLPPETINSGGLGTTLPPETINGGALAATAAQREGRRNGQRGVRRRNRNRKGRKGKGQNGRRTRVKDEERV